jgi:hypothetical protein
MICTQCEGAIPDGASACPHCGAVVVIAEGIGTDATVGIAPPLAAVGDSPFGAPAAPSTATPGPSSAPAFKFDASRWSQNDRIAGVATLVLFVSLFLPWFSFHFVIASVSISGLTAHGYLYLVLLICLATFAYLVARAGFEQMPFKLPMAHEPVLLIATVVNLVLVLIGVIDKPSLWGWSFGGFLALIAAGVAAAPLGLPAIQAHRKPTSP